MFLKKKELEILSPVSGELISLKDVPDSNFRDGIMGKGLAIIPAENRIYAPVSGVVTSLFPTLHAIGITTKEGVELLIHVGINTVNLGGVCFEAKVDKGAGVKRGNLLITADIRKIIREGYNIAIPIVICNADEFKDITYTALGMVSKGDIIMKVKL